MRDFIYSLFVHALCFQILFGASLFELGQRKQRRPASFGYEIELDALKTRLVEFKEKIKGKEVKPEDCGEEEEQEGMSEEELMLMSLFGESSTVYSREDMAFNKYVDSLEGNACGVVENAKHEPAAEQCVSKKIPGYIETKASEIMKAEAESIEEDFRADFSLENKEVRDFHKEALFLMGEVRKYLTDDSLSKEDRVGLLVEFLGSVSLPMRDLVTVLRAYTPLEYDGKYFYESLLPEFSGSLIEDELTKDLIQSGPNKMVENFYLEVESRGWGKAGLRYNANDVIARDIVALLNAPTAKNYTRASKWMTLQMMLTQVATYDAMMGIEEPIEIPNSCQNHLNGDLPESIKMQYSSEDGDGLLNRILADHGLIYSEGNTDYSEFYYDLENKDPMKESYSGLMPFETYKAAMQDIYDSEGKSHLDILNATLDDYQNFSEVVEVLRPKALGEFQDNNSWVFGLIDFEDEVFKGANLFNKVLAQPETSEVYEYTSDEGDTVEIDHVAQNLSIFLVELMQRHKVDHWDKLINGDLKLKLEQTQIRIKFPSLYGATAWRMWALRELEDFSNRVDIKDASVQRAFNKAYISANHKLNPSRKIEDRIAALKSYLSELKVSDEFIPTRRLNTEEHRKGYRLLERLWTELVLGTNYLEKAKLTELDYLSAQMQNGNPWARLRLSYLVLMNELEFITSEAKPTYSKISSDEYSKTSLKACLSRDISDLRSRLNKASKKMGLTNPLEPGYANLVVKDKEREQVFSTVVDKASPLFKQLNTSGKPFYQDLEEVTYTTLLSKADVEKFVDEKLPAGLHDMAWEGIEDFLETDEADVGRFFTDLYRLKGNPEKQMEYFEQYSQDFGIDNSYDVKRTFLVMDNNIKMHVLKSLLRSSANLRKVKIMQEMDVLCNLEPNDQESFKTLFYTTSKAQNQLNQLTGAPTVPNDVMEKINGKLAQMSSEETKDMWLGIGAGVLGVAAMLIGGACTGVTGGICAPLGVAMMAAGASAMTMQANLVTREFARKKHADMNTEKVKSFEELGFANIGASDNVSRSWFWTIFETVSIIPLIGITARSVKVGSKMTYLFAENTLKSGLRQGIKVTGRSSGTVYSEADVAFSRLVLGFSSPVAQAKEVINAVGKSSVALKNALLNAGRKGMDPKIISRGIRRIRNLHKLHRQGKISLVAMTRKIGKIIFGIQGVAKTYVSKVAVKETVESIDKQTAKTVAEYFANNPKGFHFLMKEYAKKVPKAIKSMERYEKGTSLLGKITLLPWARNGIRSLRSSHLTKYADNILRVEREAAELVAKNGNLEEYILKNVDELTDIFKDIPMRKRELPYMFFIQGGPHLGKSLSSISARGVNKATYWASNGLVMRKFFNARSRLIYEGAKSQAKSILGLSTYVSAETALESFKSFQISVVNAATKAGDDAGAEILQQYTKLEDKLVNEIYGAVRQYLDSSKLVHLKDGITGGKKRLLSGVTELDETALKKVIFAPETEQEKALGVVIWSVLPVEKLFKLDEIGDVAHRVIRELANYENVGEYEKLLNAFKVLVIKRDPGVVEIM